MTAAEEPQSEIGAVYRKSRRQIFARAFARPRFSGKWGRMSDISQATLKFADDVVRLRTPVAVLVALQNLSRSTVEIGVLGAWSLPRYIRERVEQRQMGVNLWLHPESPLIIGRATRKSSPPTASRCWP